MKTKFVVLNIAMAAGATLSASAQSGGPFALKWSTIDGGGGTSRGGRFAVSGTIGQPDAGAHAGQQFNLAGGFWSGLGVLQTPGAPLLKIKPGGAGQAILSWPVSVTGFVLEESSSAAPAPSWSTASQSVVDTATEHTVSVPAAGVMKVLPSQTSLIPKKATMTTAARGSRWAPPVFQRQPHSAPK